MDNDAAGPSPKGPLGRTVGGLATVKREQLSNDLKKYIRANRRMTGAQLVVILAAIVPHLIAGPAFTAMGFSSIGPVAGKSLVQYLLLRELLMTDRIGGCWLPVRIRHASHIQWFAKRGHGRIWSPLC